MSRHLRNIYLFPDSPTETVLRQSGFVTPAGCTGPGIWPGKSLPSAFLEMHSGIDQPDQPDSANRENQKRVLMSAVTGCRAAQLHRVFCVVRFPEFFVPDKPGLSHRHDRSRERVQISIGMRRLETEPADHAPPEHQ